MRAGTGKNESRAGRSEAGDDRLYSVDGGGADTVSRVITHSQGGDDCFTIGGQDGARAASVQATAWFEPIEDNDCKDGVCPVPWATTPYLPDLKPDLVNHPPHYTNGGIECIEAIEAQLTNEEYRGYLKGNITKYIWRERHKGGTESLKKARFYLDRLIELGDN